MGKFRKNLVNVTDVIDAMDETQKFRKILPNVADVIDVMGKFRKFFALTDPGLLGTYQNGNFNLTFEYYLSVGTTTKKIKSQKPEIRVQETLSQFFEFNDLFYFVFVGKAVFIGFHKT